MSGYSFPTADYNADNCALLFVPIADIPFFRRLWQLMQHRETWADRESWFRGYQEAAWLEEMLMTGNLYELIEGQRRIYRLLDSIFNGATYSADTSEPPIITPAIPAVPSTPAEIAAGLRKQLLDMQGILPSGWPFGWGNRPATVADVVRALRNDSTSQVNRVKDTFDLLQRSAQVATIFGTVANFLEDGAEDLAEGGILATLIVSIMAQSAMMGAQAGQLDQLLAKMDRLVISLDGGGETAPGGDVLTELKNIDTMLS